MAKENVSRNFGFLLNDVARLLRTTYDRRIRDLGLTRSQWWVLTHLYREEGVTQSELADVLEVEKASLGRLLDRLESKGWIRRENCTIDRRAKRVYLTDEVNPAMSELRAVAAGVRRDAMSGLDPEAQEQFVDTLLAIKANLLALDDGPRNDVSAATAAESTMEATA